MHQKHSLPYKIQCVPLRPTNDPDRICCISLSLSLSLYVKTNIKTAQLKRQIRGILHRELRELIKVSISLADRDKNWSVLAVRKVIERIRTHFFTTTAVTARVTYNPSHTPRVNCLLQPFTALLRLLLNCIGLQPAWKSLIRLRLHLKRQLKQLNEVC